MKPDFAIRAERAADAATRLVIFIAGSAVGAWLLFAALDAFISWVS